ncbi:DUF368 domain-containing protein [Salibacter halophilus]|uniref:DUF368 domain-containing protein n=1 Tax=Salibacter halophilus TaxID=1803916 RepID=A0A6N6M978_9FLAO|nr:DUF368 domain-containing protein [Salibacter halophilus]KAB1065049.1 DUF368 domain-containing protein [Salibacter halophilus]
MSRTVKEYLGIAIRGMGMGAADVVPGVSGGTIAFITGIYEELIETINKFDLNTFKVLREQGLAAAWNHVNGNFIVSLLLGIGISVVSLAKAITYLLENHPIPIWSFFFGLVAASIWFVAKQVKKWTFPPILTFIIGASIAYYITILSATQGPISYPYYFLSGMVAICAMILPGISGSFILLLMGSYKAVLDAVHERDFAIIATVGAGAIIGLLSFSRLLKWMFHKYHDATIALLSGFLLGSLNKIWPWKETISTMVKKAGTPEEEVVPVEQVSVLPLQFEQITGAPSQIGLAIGLMIAGAAFIILIEKVAIQKED